MISVKSESRFVVCVYLVSQKECVGIMNAPYVSKSFDT